MTPYYWVVLIFCFCTLEVFSQHCDGDNDENKTTCTKCSASPLEIEFDQCCSASTTLRLCEFCLSDLDVCAKAFEEFESQEKRSAKNAPEFWKRGADDNKFWKRGTGSRYLRV